MAGPIVFDVGSLRSRCAPTPGITRLRRRPEASATMARAGGACLSVGSSDDDDDSADGRAPVGHGHLLGGARRNRGKQIQPWRRPNHHVRNNPD
jgi:hypothetical protein